MVRRNAALLTDCSEEAKALNVAERAAKKRKTLWPSHNTRKTNAQKTNRIDTSSGSRTPAGEDWELACEICNQQGVNLVCSPSNQKYPDFLTSLSG